MRVANNAFGGPTSRVAGGLLWHRHQCLIWRHVGSVPSRRQCGSKPPCVDTCRSVLSQETIPTYTSRRLSRSSCMPATVRRAQACRNACWPTCRNRIRLGLADKGQGPDVPAGLSDRCCRCRLLPSLDHPEAVFGHVLLEKKLLGPSAVRIQLEQLRRRLAKRAERDASAVG